MDKPQFVTGWRKQGEGRGDSKFSHLHNGGSVVKGQSFTSPTPLEKPKNPVASIRAIADNTTTPLSFAVFQQHLCLIPAKGKRGETISESVLNSLGITVLERRENGGLPLLVVTFPKNYSRWRSNGRNEFTVRTNGGLEKLRMTYRINNMGNFAAITKITLPAT